MKIHQTLNLAWRNLWRNKRRSLVTLLSLAFGLAAVALFAGYTYATYAALSQSAIHSELIGHLNIERNGWKTQGKLQPEKYLLREDEIAKIREIVAKRLPNALIAPRLTVSGLLSNGNNSTIFVGGALNPADLDLLRGSFKNASSGLDAAKPEGIVVAQDLAEMLGLKTNSDASMLVSTLNGQANVSDALILDSVNTGNTATNDKLAWMTLDLAQNLLDAKGRAEGLTVLALDEIPKTDDLKDVMFTNSAPNEAKTLEWQRQLAMDFKAAGLDVQVETWQEMSVFYKQVKTMYDMIFAMMLAVVLAVVVLSIANAMGMAVLERTREIGTLRSIGLRSKGVIALFLSEAFLLVLIGSIAGLVLAGLARYGVNAADIRYVPPASSISVPVFVGWDWARTFFAFISLMLLTLLAAYWPARRAAKQSITESLGHI